jgi:alanine-glyoxylate transaminase/serine-glyoxylate transaminase/serine-pyruvate transaminase
MIYALHEGLRIVHKEGLQARWARHAQAHAALRAALAVLGFERFAPEGEQLSSLLAVRVPEAIDEAAVRGALLHEDGIEVSGGLGPLAGRAWRIGVMGDGARPEPQERLVRATARRTGGDEAAAVRALHEGWEATSEAAA